MYGEEMREMGVQDTCLSSGQRKALPSQEYVPGVATGGPALLKMQHVLGLRMEGFGKHVTGMLLLAQQELVTFNTLVNSMGWIYKSG